MLFLIPMPYNLFWMQNYDVKQHTINLHFTPANVVYSLVMIFIIYGLKFYPQTHFLLRILKFPLCKRIQHEKLTYALHNRSLYYVQITFKYSFFEYTSLKKYFELIKHFLPCRKKFKFMYLR